jgi:two-component system chemotaxis sensor kinase CheA
VLPKIADPTEGLLVIVEQDGRQAALLVDELLGQQQVVIKSLERHFTKIRGVAGATILGDGRVTLILDVPGLVALAGMRESVAA